MRLARWAFPLIVAGGALALSGAAAARPAHHCGSVSIGNDHYTHVVAKGVSCTYATTVFIPALDTNNSVPGWGELPPHHVTSTETKDRFKKGHKEISLTFTLG